MQTINQDESGQNRDNLPGASGVNGVLGELIHLNDNGAWSWFMDERVAVHFGKLIVGSVSSTDLSMKDGKDLPEWGNIELSVHDLKTGKTDIVRLHDTLEQDDHNGPSIHRMPDDRLLVIYSKHARERVVYWRRSKPGDPLSWEPIQQLETPGVDATAYGGNNVTYSNPFQPADEGGKLYNFLRCVGHQQNYLVSDDNAETWRYGGGFLHGYSGYAPYFKYSSNGKDTFFFIGTEDHPRNYDNSVYAGFIKGGNIYKSDGTLHGPLSTTTDKSGDIWDMTLVYKGDEDHVAWVNDLHLDKDGQPVCTFSVQRDGKGLEPGNGGFDHRFHYARWDGKQWLEHEVCYAGTRLYTYEDDYTGLITLDPQDTNRIYVSTDAHPVTGKPLISDADRQRHRELFTGVTKDGGASWEWTAVTSHSDADNLRPIVPIWDDPQGRTALVWMRGGYQHNTGPWDTKVVARIGAW